MPWLPVSWCGARVFASLVGGSVQLVGCVSSGLPGRSVLAWRGLVVGFVSLVAIAAAGSPCGAVATFSVVVVLGGLSAGRSGRPVSCWWQQRLPRIRRVGISIRSHELEPETAWPLCPYPTPLATVFDC